MKVVSYVYNALSRLARRIKRMKNVALIFLAIAMGVIFPLLQKIISGVQLSDGERNGLIIVAFGIVFLIIIVRYLEKKESNKRVDEIKKAIKGNSERTQRAWIKKLIRDTVKETIEKQKTIIK